MVLKQNRQVYSLGMNFKKNEKRDNFCCCLKLFIYAMKYSSVF